VKSRRPTQVYQAGAQGSFLYRMVTAVPRWMWDNKFKTGIIIVLIYVFRRVWLFYQSYIKPFFDLGKMMSSKKPEAKDNQNSLPSGEEESDGEYYDEVVADDS